LNLRELAGNAKRVFPERFYLKMIIIIVRTHASGELPRPILGVDLETRQLDPERHPLAARRRQAGTPESQNAPKSSAPNGDER
jgi:hypothetical protein